MVLQLSAELLQATSVVVEQAVTEPYQAAQVDLSLVGSPVQPLEVVVVAVELAASARVSQDIPAVTEEMATLLSILSYDQDRNPTSSSGTQHKYRAVA
jgi:hypothetical protein